MIVVSDTQYYNTYQLIGQKLVQGSLSVSSARTLFLIVKLCRRGQQHKHSILIVQSRSTRIISSISLLS